jgi:two-component system phosphate regulon sensor histidine kinase PhoR
MAVKLKQVGLKGRLGSILILLVMLPAVFYSVYEFTTLSRSEELIADVYRQQLDVVLFSLNQYSWDVANSWANTINDVLSATSTTDADRASLFVKFLSENAGLSGLFIADRGLAPPQIYHPQAPAGRGTTLSVKDVWDLLNRHADNLDRLSKLQESGYRKIDPVWMGDANGERSLALVFIAGRREGKRHIAGIVIDEETFVRDFLAQKMVEAAGDNFLLSVNRKGTGQVIYATGDMGEGKVSQTKDLWLFSDYSVGIRLKGETIEEVVQSRFYRNLLLIGLLNVVLIAGIWVVYRTVRKEIELAQLKSDFVSNVSHEIKTPLALIRMFAETLQLKRVKSEAKKQDYYDTIVQESERLTRLINNILNFSRMEAGKKEYNFEPTDLSALVGGVLKNYHAHLEHEGFTVSMETDRRLPSINIDSGAVSEAILNIIDNAVKYSREKKYLRVSTGLEGGTVFLDIEDHGIGIDPRQQKRIFEKFYRVSSGLTQQTGGTGLGLTLVKHIMDAHRGAITVRSEVGKGSTFRLTFPIDPIQRT